MVDKDIYIRILEFGINRAEGFTYNEIINAKESKKLKEWEIAIIDKHLLNAFENKQLVDLMKSADYDSMFVIIEGGGSNYKDDKYKYALSVDSRFKYIDYKELELTREISLRASRDARIAIWFAVTTIAISIFLTLWQIKSPIEIEGKQIDSIINRISNIIKN